MRKVEVLAGIERRRRFSEEEKARIVAESFSPGATVAATARKHELSPSLLYLWRKRHAEVAPPFADESQVSAPVFARALPPPPVMTAEPIRLHLYEQMVIELPAGVDVASIAALAAALRL